MLPKETAEICANKSWKLIHGQKTFSSNLSNPNADNLFGWKTWKKINVKKIALFV